MIDGGASILATAAACGLVLGAVDVFYGARGLGASAILACLAFFFAAGALGGCALLVLGLPVLLSRDGGIKRGHALVIAAAIGGLVFLAMNQALRTPLLTSEDMRWRFRLALSVPSLGAAAVAYAGVVFRTRAFARVAAVLAAVLGAAALVCDRLLVVALYARLHTVIEVFGFLALSYAGAVALASSRWVHTARTIAFVGIGWLLVLFVSHGARARLESSLPSSSDKDLVYLGRLLRRLRVVESVTSGTEAGMPAGMRHLAERYEIHDTRLDDEWRAARARGAEPAEAPWNVAVFFVDTLRADVAFDEQIMPATNTWMRENISFSRAYSPGSSTLLALAQTLNGRYEATPVNPPRLLDAAREHGMRSALFIPTLASEYHRTFFPLFRFDDEHVVSQTEGAKTPTSGALVEDALRWLDGRGPEPFFLWLYHYDLHGWNDLDERHVQAMTDEAKLSKNAPLPLRYRAAAHGIDRTFARFRDGLKERGLLDRTIVVFLSDHGEALGERGHMAHSTYLWESLVRVPLAFEVPGLDAKRVDEPVSLIDLPTTLSPFIGAIPDEEHCEGEDLLGGEPGPRRLPILLSAMIDGGIARIGLLPSAERKLDVDLREGSVRLLHLPSEENISADASGELALLLDRLVRSPIYPRP